MDRIVKKLICLSTFSRFMVLRKFSAKIAKKRKTPNPPKAVPYLPRKVLVFLFMLK
jgi:hypothetical protein